MTIGSVADLTISRTKMMNKGNPMPTLNPTKGSSSCIPCRVRKSLHLRDVQSVKLFSI